VSGAMSEDVLVRADGVSKKFCRDLKRSLWYGVQDTLRDFLGRDGSEQELRRDEFWAVNGASFELRRGECLGLIGRNGAGKTTLLKMLNGLIKPDKGRIEMRGRVGALIALGAGFNPILTGRENIYVNGAVLGLSKKEIDAKYEEIVEFAEIGEFIDAPVQSYSSGMAVRLGFAVATATDPDVLLLDEVLAVGDVSFQAKCFNVLAEFRKRGTCFIFVSHNMHMISRYCQKVMYVRHGQVRFMGGVTDGVARFLEEMKTSNADEGSNGPDWSQTLGSGKVKLLRSQFLNARNQEITEIEVGDAVTLAIDYTRCAIEIGEPVLDIMIRDNTQIVYQGSNTASGKHFAVLPKKGRFIVNFGVIPSNVELFDFFVSISDGKTNEIFDWKRHIRLRVRPKLHHQGTLALQPIWSVATISDEAPDES
jgi:lipopolysaccharide transport system ATP-binding protein